MKSLYISDLQKGMFLNGESFAVQQVEKAETKDKKPYYKLFLGDKTGSIRAFVWSESIANIERGCLHEGNVILLDANVEEFKGIMQLNIQKANKVDESVLEEFMEGSAFDLDELWGMLEKHIHSIKNEKIHKFIVSIFADEEIKKQYRVIPAGEYVHHAFRGGLLEHVVEMLDLTQPLKKYYPEADFDLISAGIILHDIGKIYELENVGVITRRTKEGYLLGHLIKSYELIMEKSKGILSKEQILRLKHIILSHHGLLQYGSPVVPATIEAAVVHAVDYASSQIRSYQRVIHKSAGIEGNFSEWDKILGTKVYHNNTEDEDDGVL